MCGMCILPGRRCKESEPGWDGIHNATLAPSLTECIKETKKVHEESDLCHNCASKHLAPAILETRLVACFTATEIVQPEWASLRQIRLTTRGHTTSWLVGTAPYDALQV